MILLPLLALVLSTLSRSPSAQGQTPLERRAHDVAALVGTDPKWAPDLFDKAFLKQVPPAKLAPIFEQYFDLIGSVVDVQLREQKSEYAANFDLVGTKDMIAPMQMTLDT